MNEQLKQIQKQNINKIGYNAYYKYKCDYLLALYDCTDPLPAIGSLFNIEFRNGMPVVVDMENEGYQYDNLIVVDIYHALDYVYELEKEAHDYISNFDIIIELEREYEV